MGSCAAYGCTNRRMKKLEGITFHSFPKDELRRKIWIKAVRRKNWLPSKHSKLCSAHFPEEMIDRTSLSCVRLRDGAYPVIFKGFPSYLQKKVIPASVGADSCGNIRRRNNQVFHSLNKRKKSNSTSSEENAFSKMCAVGSVSYIGSELTLPKVEPRTIHSDNTISWELETTCIKVEPEIAASGIETDEEPEPDETTLLESTRNQVVIVHIKKEIE